MHIRFQALLGILLVLGFCFSGGGCASGQPAQTSDAQNQRSEEHTSELQSQSNLVCRLLLEKKKKSYLVAQDEKYWHMRDHAVRHPGMDLIQPVTTQPRDHTQLSTERSPPKDSTELWLRLSR